MMRLKNIFLSTLLFCSITGYSQFEDYQYKRKLSGISERWHSLLLPNEIYHHCNQDLSDLRIYGITAKKDTLEVPFVLETKADKTVKREVAFKILNKSANSEGFYYTFKIASKSSINQIKLDFEEQNFDWKVTLEGSRDQSEWFRILKDYRILSIENSQTNYQFTDLNFSDSDFEYYRLQIKSKEITEFKQAYLIGRKTKKGVYRYFNSQVIDQIYDEDSGTSQFEIQFINPIRVNQIEIFINEKYDYYRGFNLKYLQDSIKTERGYLKKYADLIEGTISSLEKNTFNFRNTNFQQLKIIIYNGNNQPLTIDSVVVKGPNQILKARFIEDADYYLVYGKSQDYKPTYDISKFQNNIPESPKPMILGEPTSIEDQNSKKEFQLFESPIWLYGIMSIIILVLGWYSIKMIKKSKD